VSPEDTHLVYHLVPDKKTEPEPQAAHARLSSWPKSQKRFGPWLAARRNELGIQMRDLADAIGIKASDLYAIETGTVGLGVGAQRKAVAYLNERA
jgi:ribosome-binding protein aMBF1 (putative translation factor)